MNARTRPELHEAFEDNTNQAKTKVEILKFKRVTIETPSEESDDRAHSELLIET